MIKFHLQNALEPFVETILLDEPSISLEEIYTKAGISSSFIKIAVQLAYNRLTKSYQFCPSGIDVPKPLYFYDLNIEVYRFIGMAIPPAMDSYQNALKPIITRILLRSLISLEDIYTKANITGFCAKQAVELAYKREVIKVKDRVIEESSSYLPSPISNLVANYLFAIPRERIIDDSVEKMLQLANY